MHTFRLGIAALSLFVGCGCASDKTYITDGASVPNTTISRLNDMASEGGVRVVRDDVVVAGRVTTSDEEGNFFRSFVVEDATGGVEVLVDMYDLATIYPEGCHLSLHLQGCALAYSDGVLQLGTRAREYDSRDVESLASRQLIDRVVRRGGDVSPVAPRRTTIAELSRELCGRKVCIEGLRLVAASSVDTLAGMTLADATWRGSALFRDARGDSVAVYTSSYASYADELIPHDEATLTGILAWSSYMGERCYHIRMSHVADYQTR